jgi:hypothetical protein
MAIYDGVVTLAEDDFPVIVELDDEHVRMSASGTEIGEWRTDECLITHVADSTYTITAEDETLSFVPNQPGLFAAALSIDREALAVAMPSEPDPGPATDDGMREAPPAQPLTMGLFYALCLLTAGLATWALVEMIFG